MTLLQRLRTVVDSFWGACFGAGVYAAWAVWANWDAGRHIAFTDSAYASHILFKWAQMRERWVKVMPRDYKRVLLAEAEAKKAGRAPAFSELVGAARG